MALIELVQRPSAHLAHLERASGTKSDGSYSNFKVSTISISNDVYVVFVSYIRVYVGGCKMSHLEYMWVGAKCRTWNINLRCAYNVWLFCFIVIALY